MDCQTHHTPYHHLQDRGSALLRSLRLQHHQLRPVQSFRRCCSSGSGRSLVGPEHPPGQELQPCWCRIGCRTLCQRAPHPCRWDSASLAGACPSWAAASLAACPAALADQSACRSASRMPRLPEADSRIGCRLWGAACPTPLLERPCPEGARHSAYRKACCRLLPAHSLGKSSRQAQQWPGRSHARRTSSKKARSG